MLVMEEGGVMSREIGETTPRRALTRVRTAAADPVVVARVAAAAVTAEGEEEEMVALQEKVGNMIDTVAIA